MKSDISEFNQVIEHEDLKFSEVVDKVYNLIQEDKIVAVHCQAGISRSVTFVASLLILKYSFENIDDILKFISDQRPEADPNDELNWRGSNGQLVKILDEIGIDLFRVYDDDNTIVVKVLNDGGVVLSGINSVRTFEAN